MWFLLPIKNRAIHDQMVQLIHQKFENAADIFTNSDQDLITACRQHWPNTHGRWLAYAKAIQQEAIETNVDLTGSENNKIVFRKLVSLALLPSSIIMRQFGGIVVGLRRHGWIEVSFTFFF